MLCTRGQQSVRKLGGALLALFALLSPSLARAHGPVSIGWDEGRLSVDPDERPLGEIFEAFARQTGVIVRGAERLRQKTSVHFVGLSFSDGLARVVAGLSYVVVEESASRGETRPFSVSVFEAPAGTDVRGMELQEIAPGRAEVERVDTDKGTVEGRTGALAARILLDQAGPQGLPLGRGREDALLGLDRGLARQAELDRQSDEIAARQGANHDRGSSAPSLGSRAAGQATNEPVDMSGGPLNL